MKRQNFIRTLSTATVGLAAATGGWMALRGTIRVRPVDSSLCGRSFLKFCEKARFATAEEAVQITARRGHAFELFFEGDEQIKTSPTEPVKGLGTLERPLATPADRRALDKVKTAMMRSRRGAVRTASNLTFGSGSSV